MTLVDLKGPGSGHSLCVGVILAIVIVIVIVIVIGADMFLHTRRCSCVGNVYKLENKMVDIQ